MKFQILSDIPSIGLIGLARTFHGHRTSGVDNKSVESFVAAKSETLAKLLWMLLPQGRMKSKS